MTGFAPVIWAIWGLLVVFMLALKVYTGRLSRDEDDQLILDDAFSNLKTEQAAIVAKMHRIEPIRKATFWLVIAATAGVVVYYVFDIFDQFK
jgi:hypothetical protein